MTEQEKQAMKDAVDRLFERLGGVAAVNEFLSSVTLHLALGVEQARLASEARAAYKKLIGGTQQDLQEP